MDSYSNLADFPSPSSSSQYYMYGDTEHHIGTHTSGSQSPINSPYDITYIPDFSHIGVYPSPEGDEEEEETSPNGKKPAAKRKRENRYKNAPPAVLSRRRAQNRASQRAYRERKDQRIKDLETMLNDVKLQNDKMSLAYNTLYEEYVQLKTAQLKEQQQQQQQHHQQQAQSHHHAAVYGNGTGLVFDPSMVGMATNNDRLDMDLFVYPDMNTGLQGIPM